MSTENIIKPGVYRIAVWRGAEGTEAQFLTVTDENDVSVLPANSPIAKYQEWAVERGPDGNVGIQVPALLRPSSSLSYKEPEEGERIILGPRRDFPSTFWSIELTPERPSPNPFIIRVPDKDLIMVVSLIHIFPPQLRLEGAPFNLDNAWAFIPVDRN